MNADYRGEPVTDLPGCKKLWASVILQALQDLNLKERKIPEDAEPKYIELITLKNEEIRLDRESANNFFFSEKRRKDLRKICDVVGVPMDEVIGAARVKVAADAA